MQTARGYVLAPEFLPNQMHCALRWGGGQKEVGSYFAIEEWWEEVGAHFSSAVGDGKGEQAYMWCAGGLMACPGVAQGLCGSCWYGPRGIHPQLLSSWTTLF